ncbi:hypothetical protein CDD80_3682 [Ophiocordyceps camponoti-rufipedis]|uniref:MFS maltose permease n=1 Tax=Ophiocordyceps camponoti-rufipedis TaxID=2004952 RepID=A0A2C5ZKN0_9HYPO|nr:hypothetical protein CDD80_3682 [Ophiocordyceps camponoti-rufipedis]
MPPRLLAGRFYPRATGSRLLTPTIGLRSATNQARPSLPFLSAPTATGRPAGRRFISARRQWFRKEAKLMVRYTLSIWGCGMAVIFIMWAIEQEKRERRHPTPREWRWSTRQSLLYAHHCAGSDWPDALKAARRVVSRLENPDYDGQDIVKLAGKPNPTLADPDLTLEDADELLPRDISAKTEEWQRGYFDAIMLAAKAAEHVDGWLYDRLLKVTVPPECVFGPSNPRPRPIRSGASGVPRAEDCQLAYPSAESWYMKMLATEGFTQRQRVDATLAYASFMQFKDQVEQAEALYDLALAEATHKIEPARLPYDTKTLVLKNEGEPPSDNMLEVLTAIANFKARKGQLSSALPMYVSLLQARRRLSNTPPPPTSSRPPPSFVDQVTGFFKQPPYPQSPGDGTRPPWRNTLERCQEAALHLYIGEILFATSSRTNGLAWTRDAVDIAEEQLRDGSLAKMEKEAKQRCRECLATSLNNWSAMAAQLAEAEQAKREKSGSRSGLLPFWRVQEPQEANSRWRSEQAAVEARADRAKELLNDDLEAQSGGVLSLFRA